MSRLRIALLALALACLAPARADDDEVEPKKKTPAPARPSLDDKIVVELTGVKQADVVYAVGDPLLAVTLAKSRGCEAVGLDTADAIKAARELARKEGVEKRVRFQALKLDDLDLKKATVVAVNLDPKQHPKVLAQLKKLPAGTRVVAADGLAGVKGRVLTYRKTIKVPVQVVRIEKRVVDGKEVEVQIVEQRVEVRDQDARIAAYTTPLKSEKE